MVLPSSIRGNAAFAKARRLSQAATRYVTRSPPGVAHTVSSCLNPSVRVLRRVFCPWRTEGRVGSCLIGSPLGRLPKEVRDIAAGLLIRREERDDDRPRAAPLTAQPVLYVRQREIIPEVRTQFHQRKTCRVLALATIRAVVVRVVNVSEGCGLQLGVFHAVTATPLGCEHPCDNSDRGKDWIGFTKMEFNLP